MVFGSLIGLSILERQTQPRFLDNLPSSLARALLCKLLHRDLAPDDLVDLISA
jgi:hypothetical protein